MSGINSVCYSEVKNGSDAWEEGGGGGGCWVARKDGRRGMQAVRW